MPEGIVTTEMLIAANDSHDHDAHAHEAESEYQGAVHDAEHAIEGAYGEHGDKDHGYGHYGRTISHPPELPHFIQWWFYSEYDGHKKAGENPYGTPDPDAGVMHGLTAAQVLHVGRLEEPVPFVDYAPWENVVFTWIAAFLLSIIVFILTAGFRRPKEQAIRKPTKVQALVEDVTMGALSFCQGVLGEENGKRYFPFLGGMFFFILSLNLMGMIPLMRAPTATLLTTMSFALATFFVYLFVGLTKLGPWELFKHLCGSPESGIQWALAPLMLIIECISFFIAKPLSLALRLFGNILGKDILFGVMLLLGLMLVPGALGDWVGFPLTFPFYFLGLLLSAIQALVFALLSAIYILMCLPHDHDHEHDEHHAEAGAH